jgi:hypothetical protein
MAHLLKKVAQATHGRMSQAAINRRILMLSSEIAK